MSIRRPLSLLSVALFTAVSITGCDDDNRTDTIIGATDASAAFVNRAVSIAPLRVRSVAVPGALCPQPTFVAPFNLVITAGGLSDVFLTHVQMQFVDRSGIVDPRTGITKVPFADRPLIPASATRTFPLQFPFGCAGVPPGTLNLVVFTSDSRQRERQTSLQVAVN